MESIRDTRKKLFNLGLSISHIDWFIFFCAILISFAGLVTMNSYIGESYFFNRQIVWIILSLIVFFTASQIDWRFLRRTGVVVSLFAFFVALLLSLLAFGSIVRGSQSWFTIGPLTFQPSDPAKLVLIILLSKYFSRRHVEIANIRHIIVSGFYAFVIFLLVFLQPDFGTAIIMFAIWFGMVLVSGISNKHLLSVILLAVVSLSFFWFFVFHDYQKQRIISFIHPLADIQGAGYNAYQSTIAVGSGQILGKGIGYGTQSKLRFLPEYETDFIFAAFAEEWGFVGVILLFSLFGTLFWRIIRASFYGQGNFEVLFGLGLAILFISHFIIHIGMNIGLLPVTGTTIPFMSYGGSHLLTEFLGLGILAGMMRYSRVTSKDTSGLEVPGISSRG